MFSGIGAHSPYIIIPTFIHNNNFDYNNMSSTKTTTETTEDSPPTTCGDASCRRDALKCTTCGFRADRCEDHSELEYFDDDDYTHSLLCPQCQGEIETLLEFAGRCCDY